MITVIAPVGPEIEYREPPVAATSIPAMTAVYKPIWGSTPEAIAKAIASGNATTAVINPAFKSLVNDSFR
jgi:ketol-acid reductoisomerase